MHLIPCQFFCCFILNMPLKCVYLIWFVIFLTVTLWIRFSNHSCKFMDAYMKGLNGWQAAWAVRVIAFCLKVSWMILRRQTLFNLFWQSLDITQQALILATYCMYQCILGSSSRNHHILLWNFANTYQTLFWTKVWDPIFDSLCSPYYLQSFV